MAENSTSIKQIIQGMNKGAAEVLQGMIISTSPFKVQIINDEKLILSQNNTYVPKHLTNFTVAFSQRLSDGKTQSGTMTINNALQAGERVHVLSFNHGKQYFVLDKV